MKRYTITVNGTPYDVTVDEAGAGAPIAAAPAAPAPVAAPAAPAPAAAAPAATGGVTVVSPMPGTILDIQVATGAAVKAGQVLAILEAMKMENEIVAPQDGTVASVNVNKGDSVNVDDIIVTLS